MTKVFGQTDKSFSSNGDIVVRPLKAKVHKEGNGDFYLDLETSLDYVNYLGEEDTHERLKDHYRNYPF